ncbi:nucleotidyltransferase [Planctomycetales bacterium]|nr:nucleotidyltransferase [Planctomycetales bacterium]
MTEMETVEKWFKKAGNDLNVAQRIFQDRHEDELDIVCFHCQQAAEKALKGYLIFYNAEPPRTHHLVKLCQSAMEIDVSFSELLDASSDLTPYAVEARYPDEELGITKPITEQALKQAELINNFCRSKVPLNNTDSL